jgi:acyl dehydratase
MNMPETPFITFEHTPNQSEFDLFARLSGDDNPIHVDATFAAGSRFGRPVAHGMMLYGLIWSRIRQHLPATRHEAQELMFPNPAFAGEPLRGVAMRRAAADGGLVIEARLSRIADDETVCLSKTRLSGGGT